MLDWLIAPLAAEVVQRALAAGVVAACLCAVVGTWVVLRGSVFLGEAMSHGMLPGVATAALLGGNLVVGALVAALAMAIGIAAIGRSSVLSSDVSIGLLLVGMLAVGVVMVSKSQSFAVDLTGYLFGDLLAVRTSDLVVLLAALLLTAVAATVGHRAFVAVTFDPRKAATLRLRPQLAVPALTVLLAIAMVASFHVVGTLLVLGLLVAPTAAALLWVRSIPRVMALSALIGCAAVYLGLLVSWHAGTAGGATIAGIAVLLFFCSAAVSALRGRIRRTTVAAAAAASLVAGCASAPPPTAAEQTVAAHDDVSVAGADELQDPLTRLVLVDPDTGATSVYDAIDETETEIGTFGPTATAIGDGRFAYLQSADDTTVVDAGAWTFDHGDHYHYFATEPGERATITPAADAVTGSNTVVAMSAPDGATLLDREKLGEGTTETIDDLALGDDVVSAVAFGSRVVVVTADGRVQVVADGATADIDAQCPGATWGMASRRAVVLGCADGALRITGDDDVTATEIAYPADAPPPPAQMRHRARADVFAGLADGYLWVLDARQRAWTVIPVPDAVAVNTAGDGSVLALLRTGDLVSYDVLTRTETARTKLFAAGVPVDGPVPVVEIDPDRAYVNNFGAREVYEIDYADGLRLARTLRTDVRPGLMVEAGR